VTARDPCAIAPIISFSLHAQNGNTRVLRPWLKPAAHLGFHALDRLAQEFDGALLRIEMPEMVLSTVVLPAPFGASR